MKKLLFILIAFIILSCEQPTIPEPTLLTAPAEPIIYTNMFKVAGYNGNGADTTQLDLRENILSYDGTDYDLDHDSSFPFDITTDGDIRTIDMWIYVDSFSSFYFVNNNMLNIKNIDPLNMTEAEFQTMIGFIYSPEDNHRFYNLNGYNGAVTDYLIVSDSEIIRNGVTFVDPELNVTYSGDDTIFSFWIFRDNKDSFLFMGTVMVDFFGIDLTRMSRAEFIIAADILNRYPEESLADLQGVYN